MKIPIKLSPSIARFIKTNNLVYVGTGNTEHPILEDKGILSLSVCEGEGEPEGMVANIGSSETFHDFITRSDAKTHFPHCLPKARKASPKVRYFINTKGFGDKTAYVRHDGDNLSRSVCVQTDGSEVHAGPCLADCEEYATNPKWGWKEVTETEAKTLLTPSKTEFERVKEELASTKAELAELATKYRDLRTKVEKARLTLS